MMFDYEKNENCFSKTIHVESKLLYGSLDNIHNPLFTVLIPTYKRVNLLKDALKSVMEQWHVPFMWDIIVLDNEPYDGERNDTEKYIREVNSKRILYYRNTENIRPGDNFNRGIFLARGKWVMMLHDDDILISNSLHNMYNIVTSLESIGKNVGAIATKYHQFKYDPNNPAKHLDEINAAHEWYLQQPTNYNLYKITHNNVIFTGHIGGDVPSNGATYNREAVLKVGGFNDDFGISADLVLYYCLEDKYDVYSTTVPFGFYRWGINTMSKPESTYNTIKFCYDFREYVYSKNIFNKLWGYVFRKYQHRRFLLNVLSYKKTGTSEKINLDDYKDIADLSVNKHIYVLYSLGIKAVYEFMKWLQMKK